MRTPLLRYADSRRRWAIVVEAEVDGLEHLGVGLERSWWCRGARWPDRPPRPAPCGLPRTYSWAQTLPSRADSTRIHSDRALTTLTPTPWRPPDTLYPPPPNLPPAWRTVWTTSRASLPVCFMLADGHAAAVVDVHEAAVRLDRDVDPRGVAGHRLVDRVVDDLPDEVMEAADIGRADVHARAAANRLEALEDLDALGGVRRCCRVSRPRRRGRCRPFRPVCPTRHASAFIGLLRPAGRRGARGRRRRSR